VAATTPLPHGALQLPIYPWSVYHISRSITHLARLEGRIAGVPCAIGWRRPQPSSFSADLNPRSPITSPQFVRPSWPHPLGPSPNRSSTSTTTIVGTRLPMTAGEHKVDASCTPVNATNRIRRSG